jgi:hypothetical protein
MPTKITFLPALMMAFLAVFSTSSCQEPCDFSPYSLYQYNWKLLELENSGAEPIIEYNSSISKEHFGLRIKYEMPIAGQLKTCPDNYYEFYDPVVEVTVYAMQDFDDTHPAGVSLNDYFIARNLSDRTNLPYYKPISESLSAFIKYSYNSVGTVDLILIQPPGHQGPFQFKVQLKFSYQDPIIISSRTITFY